MLKNCKGKERLQCFCDTIKIPNEDTFFCGKLWCHKYHILAQIFFSLSNYDVKEKPGLQIVNDKTYNFDGYIY